MIPPGKDNIIYLVLENQTLYYWDNDYKPLITNNNDEADFKTARIEFDGSEIIFDLPIDDKTLNVYVNGIYLTEDEDYTIDRNISPNQINFVDTWDETDICTITWIEGTVFSGGGSSNSNLGLATKEDIDKMFSEIEGAKFALASKEDINKMFEGR